jgi:hypothetical protein
VLRYPSLFQIRSYVPGNARIILERIFSNATGFLLVLVTQDNAFREYRKVMFKVSSVKFLAVCDCLENAA